MENSNPGPVQNQYLGGWAQQDSNIINSSHNVNISQQAQPPFNISSGNLPWNAPWPPPPFAHLQQFPPPPLPLPPPPALVQQYRPQPTNDGSYVTHSFMYQQYNVSSTFRNTSENRQVPGIGALYNNNSSLPTFEDGESEEKTQRQKNQEFLNEFLERCSIKRSCETPTSCAKVNISNVQLKLKECLHLMNKLKAIRNNLCNPLDCDELAWNKFAGQASGIKKRLQASLMDLNSVELRSLELYIQKRNRKRKRLQRQKLMQKEERREKEQLTKCLHEKIDAWQESIRHSHLATEMEKKLKKEADSILSEVRRKCAEANRMLDLVTSVSKLRALKKLAAANKGLYTTTECDEAFASNMSKLEKLLIARLAEYAEEERTLQVMLDEEHQVTRESAIKIRQQEQKEKLEVAKQQKAFCLFGPEDAINEMDPRYIYREYYTRPERSLDALIQVRQSWDIWLVPPTTPHSSGLPLTWVIPVKPSSSAWASYLGEQLP